MARFTVEAGRAIFRDGRPYISIGRSAETVPTQADFITHVIAAVLSGEDTFTYCDDEYQTETALRDIRRSR